MNWFHEILSNDLIYWIFLNTMCESIVCTSQQSQNVTWGIWTWDVLITGWSGVFRGLNNDFFWSLFFPKTNSVSNHQCQQNLFLTIVLGSQVDHNFIQVVSQISRVLQFEITQKEFHLKHFTIAKPLLYLVLRVKKLTLPGKCAQTGQGSRKYDFWALLKTIRLFCCF